MTEIALALAMAFFAIMILTLVSMSGQDRVIQVNQIKTTSEQIWLLAPEGQASQGKGKARVLQARDLIIIYRRALLRRQTAAPGSRPHGRHEGTRSGGRAPSFPGGGAGGEGRLALPDLTVTTLNQH